MCFSMKNEQVQCVNYSGTVFFYFFVLFVFFFLRCPVKTQVMTKFVYDQSTGSADATVFSMFKFPGNDQVHLQCDIAVCKGESEPVFVYSTDSYLSR